MHFSSLLLNFNSSTKITIMKSNLEMVGEKPCIQQIVSKRKMDYMKECNFSDTDVELFVDIKPDPEKYSEYIEKNLVDRSTLHRPQFAEHDVSSYTQYIY